jgi:arylsulfatase
LTQVQDILPTLVDLCGFEPLETRLDGISLAPALRNEGVVPEDRMIAVNFSRMPSYDYPTPDCQAVIRREGAAVLWKRWRLLEGTALYNLEADPGQESNVIDLHPETTQMLTDCLDAWWKEVEPVANQVQRIMIGSDQENPMMLSACEWRDVFVDQQRQVRIGERKNSYWHLQVERAGTYRFELRRWPEESGLCLSEACPAAHLTDGYLEAGRALPIARARILIERQQHIQAVGPDDEAAIFTVQLNAGPTLLHTWFDDAHNQPICGAYYVLVTRLD